MYSVVSLKQVNRNDSADILLDGSGLYTSWDHIQVFTCVSTN